jgi:23S rRNA (cytidine2498-2'-O)-methyltransferase
MSTETPLQQARGKKWIVHLGQEFADVWFERCKANGISQKKLIGEDFFLVDFSDEVGAADLTSHIFARYLMPVTYMWPVKVDSDSYIERAATGIMERFKNSGFANVQVFALEPGASQLASNLRGRLLQLADATLVTNSKGHFAKWRQEPKQQPPELSTLVVALGRSCTYAGVIRPRESGNFYAGGRRYVSLSSDESVSRAAAKYVQAEEHCLLHGISLEKSKSWLELGACPGGMTTELANRGFHVHAIDRSPLDPRVQQDKNVTFTLGDTKDFQPTKTFDALLCDMNGPPRFSWEQVARLSNSLKEGGIIIHTLKIPEISQFDSLELKLKEAFSEQNINVFSLFHLFHNRQEITIFGVKKRR